MKSPTLISSAAYADTKPHYALLDGLRGVAAPLVVFYHVYEGFSFGPQGGIVKTVNHGYLAVDFFFMLSGFVLGYAYDDRWGRTLTFRNFVRRRLIRLHPMIVMGALIGALSFCLQGCVRWNGAEVSLLWVMVALFCTMFFIPAYPGAPFEVRGSAEMFPLNGPTWTLFFEYIGNLLYALLFRRLSFRWLALFSLVCGLVLSWFAIGDPMGYGMLGVGWSLKGLNFYAGLFRMLYPFSLGLLLSRVFVPCKVRGAFWICSLTLVVLFCVPYLGGLWNGLYEMFCITVVFPLLVWLGASGRTTDRLSESVCRWLGDISFPVYAVHYPLMYLFFAWLIKTGQFTLAETWPVVIAVILGSLLLAWLSLKFYDIPLRRWLSRRFQPKTEAGGH